MNLRNITPNCHELALANKFFLLSYGTIVAAFVPGEGWFRTQSHYSKTTTRHINKWLKGARNVSIVPKCELELLIKGA